MCAQNMMESATSWMTQTVMPTRDGGRVRNCMSLWSGGERKFVDMISGLALEKNGPFVQCFDLERRGKKFNRYIILTTKLGNRDEVVIYLWDIENI